MHEHVASVDFALWVIAIVCFLLSALGVTVLPPPPSNPRLYLLALGLFFAALTVVI
jgi:hypothetical protein